MDHLQWSVCCRSEQSVWNTKTRMQRKSCTWNEFKNMYINTQTSAKPMETVSYSKSRLLQSTRLFIYSINFIRVAVHITRVTRVHMRENTYKPSSTEDALIRVHYRVLRGLQFCVRARPAPAKLKQALPRWSLRNFARTRTADHPNPPALFRSQTSTCPKTTKNS